MPDLRSSDRRGDPTVALFLTWFLPGAGHLYLGRVGWAGLAFVLVEGLYALGWWLADGRAFEVLDPELQSAMATVLTPEVGNLGAMIAQLKLVGFGLADPQPLPPHFALGGLLTALSGVMNVFFMIHAHLAARTPAQALRRGPHPVLAVALAWMVPGLGHFAQGRRLRGAVIFALLVGFFFWGTWLAEGSNLSRERHFYYWSGQYMLGLPALLSEILSGRPPVTGPIARVDVGLLFACMPGLLNILAMLDVFGVAETRWLSTASAASQGASAATVAEEAQGAGGTESEGVAS